MAFFSCRSYSLDFLKKFSKAFVSVLEKWPLTTLLEKVKQIPKVIKWRGKDLQHLDEDKI